MKKKGISYWIGVVSTALLVTTPVAVIFNPDLFWGDVAIAMIVWAVVGFICGAVNLNFPDSKR